MKDYIDEAFADLDEYYPNSKRKRREVSQKMVAEKPEWDVRPTQKTLPNGTQIDMYTINALASALNRPVHTLRLWMKEGNLPSPPYRLPTKVDSSGKERPGRRLYSRRMIESAVEIFHRAGLLHTDRVQWSSNRQVTQEIAESWSKIREEENQ